MAVGRHFAYLTLENLNWFRKLDKISINEDQRCKFARERKRSGIDAVPRMNK